WSNTSARPRISNHSPPQSTRTFPPSTTTAVSLLSVLPLRFSPASSRCAAKWMNRHNRPSGTTCGDRRSRSTMIHRDGFHLGKEVHGVATLFVGADAAGFDAAKGEVDFAAQGGLIDVGDADVDAVDEVEDRLYISGVDRGGEAVLDGVGGFEGGVGVGDADQR